MTTRFINYLLISAALMCITLAGSAQAAPPIDPRNAYEVSYELLRQAISSQLTGKGAGDKVGVQINGQQTNKPFFSYNQPISVEARDLQFDGATGRWQANVLIFANDTVISALPTSGHFDEMAEITVLKHEVRNGEIIRENDLEIRDYNARQTRADTITDLSGLLGKTPVHTISPYRPIRVSEVMNPSIVKKDAIVQMHYNLPGMNISTEGQAMTAGAQGDVIAVRNVNSKKIIRAVIEDAQTVNAYAVGGEHASIQ